MFANAALSPIRPRSGWPPSSIEPGTRTNCNYHGKRRRAMAIKGEWIRYGDEVGYFAAPERAAKPLPGVVVIQEIWGVNDQIEDVTRRIAAAGYAALAPDVYALRGERPAALKMERVEEAMAFMATMPPNSRFDPAARAAELAKLPDQKRQRIEESFVKIFSMPAVLPSFVAPLRKAVGYLRTERPETKGRKIGCVGFCMGGGLSALLACEEPELAGAAIFYGSAPPAEKVAGIRCPVIGFYGANDQRVNAGIPGFEEAMRKAGKSFEQRVYPGANHAFFNDTGGAYEVNAARDSFARLLTFFADKLTD
jgi:carboxymethylenebutenolidase